MAKLDKSERNALPGSDFAGPGRSYPIEDEEHGRKAIQLGARAEHAGTLSAAQYEAIKAKVHARYPSIGGGHSPFQLRKRR